MPTFNNLFWLILMTISIEMGFIGYLVSLNVNLDFVTMMMLLMNITFSTNSIVHLSYAYYESINLSGKKKIRNTLFTIGLPLIQNYLLKFLIVLSIVQSTSFSSVNHFYLVFGKSILILIALAIFHELLLLPILLSFSDSMCSESMYSTDKHLNDLSDLDEDSDDDFNRKNKKSYYKSNTRHRLHDSSPFYYTEKFFDGKQLTINNRSVGIPRLIQPTSDKLDNEINFLASDNKLSVINARTMSKMNSHHVPIEQPKNQPITIWSNDEDIRNDVISKFNDHWRQINQTDHPSNKLINRDVLKQQTGIF